jgi:enoyl-CoA hydratase
LSGSEEAELLLVSDEDGARTITLNRPARKNALSGGLVRALCNALREAARDDEVHVIVITGAGDTFCAGGDLSPGASGAMAMHEDRLSYVELLSVLGGLGKPTVAKINGRALGGGFGLALACDLAVACRSAQLGTPEVRLGLFPMMIMPLVLRHLGRKRTLELILTGGRMSADEALGAGCLNRVVDDGELDTATDELVARLRSFSPAVHRLGLQHFHRMADLPLEPATALLADGLGLNTLLEDTAEGISAFLQKRSPSWRGR